MVKKFYEETGMYIDWAQIKRLPKIDTFVDIGVGTSGTEDLYNHFINSKLILIDPIEESKIYAEKLSKKREVIFFQNAIGRKDGIEKDMNLQKSKGFSSFLETTSINKRDDFEKIKKIKIQTLDTTLSGKENLGKIGIKIDTEGYELEVILGASETLKHTKFVIAEVRHNHVSFEGAYKLHEFVNLMFKNNFTLTTILTAKPFIADLCFQPISEVK